MMLVRNAVGRLLVLTAITIASLGCQHSDQRQDKQCQQCDRARLAQSTPLGAPEVVVIGAAAPRTQTAALETLTYAIRSRMTTIGGLRILETPPIDCEPPCETQCETTGVHTAVFDASQTDDHPAIFTTGAQQEYCDPSDGFEGESSAVWGGQRVHVGIVIDEFIPYRPMKLAATITVRNAYTDEELTRIQGTWYGNEEPEPLADANHSLQRALKRPKPRIVAEAGNLVGISPTRFLQSVAGKVAPAIHQACLSSGL